jgi:uncharacterized protein YlaI
VVQTAWRIKNRELLLISRAKSLYGISEKQYEQLFHMHKKCGICGTAPSQIDKRTGKVKRLAIDHNHKTGIIRGLLCTRCNLGIGNFRADNGVDLFVKAIKYIKNSWRMYG